MRITRYLAMAWSVLRAIPATVLCTIGSMVCVMVALSEPVASPLGTLLVIYGGWRGFRRQYALARWTPWVP